MRFPSDNDNNDMLGRAYTRTMPTVRRSLSQLQESMNYVKMQWNTITNEYSGRVENISSAEIKALHSRVERIASQLKAIKQELVPLLLNRQTLSVSSGEEYFQQNDILATTTTTTTTTTSTTTVSNSIISDTTEMCEGRELTQLSVQVYVWSVCMAIVLNDIDFLSSSLSSISSCNLFFEDSSDNNNNITSREASAFFFGTESTLGMSSLRDREVLLICELLYRLYTRDDAAAENLMSRVESLLKDSKEMSELLDDNNECESNNNNNNNNVYGIITRMARWVATEEYGELNAFLSRSFTTLNREISISLSPLILLFVQVMNNRVVIRQLQQSNFQNVWRPVIDVNSTSTSTSILTSTDNTETREIDAFPSSWLSSTEGRRLAVCIMLQRESLLQGCLVWPLPSTVSNYCFRLSFNEQR